MKRLSVLVLAILYVIWPTYQIIDYILAQPFAETMDILNYIASIAAFNWLLLNVLLALKLPVLQRIFPYDYRIRIHIITSMGVMLFLAWHGIYYGIVLN